MLRAVHADKNIKSKKKTISSKKCELEEMVFLLTIDEIMPYVKREEGERKIIYLFL